ncbi:MAG: D-alanine--D-alanine ligase [bacterium]|nr:D-alanine--D-alanine ligase [bacterium]
MIVLVLAGGTSGEREVSLTTGQAVVESLRRLGHEVLALDPATGCSLLGSEGKYQIPGEASDPAKTTVVAESGILSNSLTDAAYRDVEVVFIALHGGEGENGTIQNLLHLAGKKYTGSDMAASAVAMDKSMSKRLMTSVKVTTPHWKLVDVSAAFDTAAVAEDIATEFELPLIVKPNEGGSTLGLTKVTACEEIAPALEKAVELGDKVLVEQFVAGREMTVAVLNGRPYSVVEIIPTNSLYDYEAKYTKGKSEYVAPAKIDDKIAEDLKVAALRVYEVIGASGLARIDFILAPDSRFYCLELNSLPGMTDLSLAPMSLKCEGIDFDRLVTLILESAVKRND